MKSYSKPEDREPLNQLLREWRVVTPPPPRFREHVWQRIGRAEAPPESEFWTGLRRWVEVLLPRPKFALAYMAALLVFGMAAGSVTAQIRSSRVEASLGARYVQSVDPYHATILEP